MADKPTGSCPICRKASATAFRPFCSQRCADVDLHRWFSEAYVIPVDEADDEDGEQPRPLDSESHS